MNGLQLVYVILGVVFMVQGNIALGAAFIALSVIFSDNNKKKRHG